MTHTIGSTEIGATIGHAGLFAILTYAVYLMFALWLSRPLSLGLAMLVVIALGPITEWSQMGLFGRTPSLMDLLADWLGATMLGFAVSFWFMLRLQKVINMVEFSRSR
ncbi:MAG: VanZ family protein [Anaerolineae bacterium]